MMTVKLTYDLHNSMPWGVAVWIPTESRWIEVARFLSRVDAMVVRKHYEHGYIAQPQR